MERLAQTEGLTDIQRDILATVRDFVDKEILPVASELEHKDEYPTQIVKGMKELGLFGLTIERSTAASASHCSPMRWWWSRSPAAGCRCRASSTPTSSWRT